MPIFIKLQTAYTPILHETFLARFDGSTTNLSTIPKRSWNNFFVSIVFVKWFSFAPNFWTTNHAAMLCRLKNAPRANRMARRAEQWCRTCLCLTRNSLTCVYRRQKFRQSRESVNNHNWRPPKGNVCVMMWVFACVLVEQVHLNTLGVGFLLSISGVRFL